ncbi:MAG TPA: hypothetical protein VIN40_04615 [Candidatus Tyrphobacter sp.]
MKRWARAGTLVFLAAVIVAALSPAAPVTAAGNPRCNGNVAGLLERQVRAYDRRPPAANVGALTQRYADLDSILQQAQLERDILESQCADDQRLPIDDHLAGVIAWAYMLQADIAGKRFSLLNCPAAVSTVPPALLASAWFALGSTANGAPLPAEVMPKLRTRASAIGLALPPFADASQYWRDSLVGKAVGCPSPSPH